jgi:hypothetical protein
MNDEAVPAPDASYPLPGKQKGKWFSRLERYLGLVAEAGEMVMSLRDKPSPLDWFGLGARAVDLAFRVRNEHRELTTDDPFDFFEDSKRWVRIGSEFHSFIKTYVTDIEALDEWWTGDEKDARVCVGRLDDQYVYWVQKDNTPHNYGIWPHVPADRSAAFFEALGKRVWKDLNSRHLQYTSGGFIADPFDQEAFEPTKQFAEYTSRLKAFLDVGCTRSALFQGPPGTGKSVGLRCLVRGLGLSSLRVDLGVFDRADLACLFLETSLKVMRPDVMVIDDVDRLEENPRLFQFLELAAKTCKVVLATANHIDQVPDALLRPGRFDEIVTVTTVDFDVVTRMMRGDKELAMLLSDLPLAYIAEAAKRLTILGRDILMSELPALRKRAKQAQAVFEHFNPENEPDEEDEDDEDDDEDDGIEFPAAA